jgi:hypothetical protein
MWLVSVWYFVDDVMQPLPYSPLKMRFYELKLLLIDAIIPCVLLVCENDTLGDNEDDDEKFVLRFPSSEVGGDVGFG